MIYKNIFDYIVLKLLKRQIGFIIFKLLHQFMSLILKIIILHQNLIYNSKSLNIHQDSKSNGTFHKLSSQVHKRS